MYDALSMPIRISAQQLLQIFVENQGRICYGPNMKDFKGIVSNVTIAGKVITNWTMIGLPLSNLSRLNSEIRERKVSGFKLLEKVFPSTKGSMTVWAGSFKTECNEEPR